MSGPEFVFGEPDEPSLEEALARAGGGEGMEGAFIDALAREVQRSIEADIARLPRWRRWWVRNGRPWWLRRVVGWVAIRLGSRGPW